MIYFDNAAGTRPIVPVPDIWGNPNSLHSKGTEAKEALESARQRIANCIGAKSSEIHFTSGASEGNWNVMQTIMEDLYTRRVNIEVSPYEHSSIADVFPLVDPPFTVRMLANNETGDIYEPADFMDATAAMGHIAIDVKSLGVSYMTCGGHKFGAPIGIGFVYVKEGLPYRSSIGGRERIGTPPVALAVAMAYALELNLEQLGTSPNLSEFRDGFEERILGELEDSMVVSFNRKKRLPLHSCLAFKGIEGATIANILDSEYGICISTGSACNSESVEPSRVMRAYNVPGDYINGVIRISGSFDNTQEDWQKLGDALIETVEYLRKM